MLSKYKARATNFRETAINLQQRYDRLGILRLGAFLALVAMVILSWREAPWWTALPLTIGGIVAFGQLVGWHSRIQSNAKHHGYLADINEQEIEALNNNYTIFETGGQFIDPLHPYSYDLDIFGSHSIFQMLNRAKTSIGQSRLASWLYEPGDTKDIEERQLAAKELSTLLDWQHNLRAYGADLSEKEGQINSLYQWLKEPPIVLGNQLRIAMLFIAPVLCVVSIYLWIMIWPWYLAFLLLLPAAWVLSKSKEAVDKLHILTGKAADTLKNYSQLIEQIEQQTFDSLLLQSLQSYFKPAGKNHASMAISKLAYRLSQLDVRYNPFAVFLQLSVAWDLQQAWRLDKWKAQYAEELPQWFESLATIEALISLGNLHLNKPSWVFPTINENNRFDAIELGHPLLPDANCVNNDIKMPTQGYMHLITGSNMAGKSTWLRSVATNMVLALSGAPVRAQSFTMPQMQVYTSMRTQDALHESTSSFYAELKRLKFIIEAVEDPTKTNGRPVFFLLDEILKGTNSRDRHTGSKALIRQLIASAGAGLIATHDLELGVLEAEANGRIENWAIEVDIQNDELYFDYKIKRGVSQSFNATLLMQKMGIKIS